MSNQLDSGANNQQISKDAVEWMLRRIIQLPKNWLIISCIFIFLSAFEINWNKELSIKFHVTTNTAIFLALLWLPSILKIFALTGGAVKTPAGEITGSSMMPMLQSLTSDTLGFLIEQTKLAEEVAPPQQQLEMRQMRHEWQKTYAARVPASESQQQMERLAERYKEIRTSMRPGAQRTFEMESITGRMRALAPEVNYSVKEVTDLLRSHRDSSGVSHDQGKRLQGLSIAEWSCDPIYFDLILHIIADSQTAFEQTCALRAMSKIVSKLELEQKRDLKKVLLEQRDFNEEQKRWIKHNSNRWFLSERLLSAIEG